MTEENLIVDIQENVSWAQKQNQIEIQKSKGFCESSWLVICMHSSPTPIFTKITVVIFFKIQQNREQDRDKSNNILEARKQEAKD